MSSGKFFVSLGVRGRWLVIDYRVCANPNIRERSMTDEAKIALKVAVIMSCRTSCVTRSPRVCSTTVMRNAKRTAFSSRVFRCVSIAPHPDEGGR
jgi:hypothetical protein